LNFHTPVVAPNNILLLLSDRKYHVYIIKYGFKPSKTIYRWRWASVYFIDRHLTGPDLVALCTHLRRWAPCDAWRQRRLPPIIGTHTLYFTVESINFNTVCLCVCVFFLNVWSIETDTHIIFYYNNVQDVPPAHRPRVLILQLLI